MVASEQLRDRADDLRMRCNIAQALRTVFLREGDALLGVVHRRIRGHG